MKKITLAFTALFIGALSYAQTITQSAVSAATINVNGSNKAVSWNPAPAGDVTITLTGFTAQANTTLTVFNQFKITDGSGDQWAGGGVGVALDANGDGSVNWAPGFFGPAIFDGSETTGFWNTNGAGVSASQTFPINIPALSTPEVSALEAARVYPNPTSGVVNITGNGVEIESVEVYNVIGSLVGNSRDLTGLVNGIYFLKLNTTGGSVTKRVVKQ